MLFFFPQLKPDIKVDKHAVGGLGGLIGRKKGAVAIYINFSGIRIVFISCHLSGSLILPTQLQGKGLVMLLFNCSWSGCSTVKGRDVSIRNF